MAQCGTCVPRLYKSIIDEVMANVRNDFLDEGIDEQVLLEVKQAWEQKVAATRATDHSDVAGPGQQQAAAQQQLQQTAHQQVASGLAGQVAGNPPATQQAPAAVQVNLVPVQITVPAQQAGGLAKTITIHVPSTALANGVAGVQLQAILSAPSAAQTFAMESQQAAEVIQRQLNAALQQRGITLPPQLLQFGSQVDGAVVALRRYPNIAAPPGCLCPSTSHQIRSKGKRGKRCCRRPPLTTQISSSDLLSSPTSSAAEVTENSCNGGSDSAGGATCTRLNPAISIDRKNMDDALLSRLVQLDGNHGHLDDSSDEMSGDDDDDDDEKEDEEEKDKKFGDEEEEEDEAGDVNEDPLNSDDDVSDDETGQTFETDNVVVCQYDKITRVRNKWKFNLKDGIMNLKGKDFVFLKATGEGEW